MVLNYQRLSEGFTDVRLQTSSKSSLLVFLHLSRDIMRTPNPKVVALTHLQ